MVGDGRRPAFRKKADGKGEVTRQQPYKEAREETGLTESRQQRGSPSPGTVSSFTWRLIAGSMRARMNIAFLIRHIKLQPSATSISRQSARIPPDRVSQPSPSVDACVPSNALNLHCMEFNTSLLRRPLRRGSEGIRTRFLSVYVSTPSKNILKRH